MVINQTYHVIELTVCFETNLLKSHEYKRDKYKNIHEEVINKNVEVLLYPIEFSSLGLVSEKFKCLLACSNLLI